MTTMVAEKAAKKTARRAPARPAGSRPLPTFEQRVATERRARATQDQRTAARRQVALERGEPQQAAARREAASRQARGRAIRHRVAITRGPRALQPARENYQPVILAEFVAAILLTATTPIATRKNQPGLSPYGGKDMLQLGALTMLYLILALASTGGRGPGRIAAWFGGLILLTVGLGQAAHIAKELDLFGIGGAPGGGSQAESSASSEEAAAGGQALGAGAAAAAQSAFGKLGG